MIVIYGEHALDITDRRIDRSWVERTVLAPDTVEADLVTREEPARSGLFLSETGACCAWYRSKTKSKFGLSRFLGPKSERPDMRTHYEPATDALYVRYSDIA